MGYKEVTTHKQAGGGAHIRTDRYNNRQKTIPTIPYIYIEIYQCKEALAEGSIDRKGELTQHMERTHQQDGRSQ